MPRGESLVVSLPARNRRSVRRVRTLPRTLVIGFFLLWAAAASRSAPAQQVEIVPSVSARATWTDNAGLQDAAVAVDDVITEITPSLAISAIGKRFRATGEIGATGVNYLNQTQRDRVLPRIGLGASLEAVERLIFVDATVATTELVENPFVGRPQGTSTVNTYTSTTYAVNPYVDWRVSPRTRLVARSENSRTETRGESSSAIEGGGFSRQRVRLDISPQPLGVAIEAERSDSRFSGQTVDTARQKFARMIAFYAPSPEWVVNLRGGREENQFAGLPRADGTIYGGGFEWRPTERTAVRGLGEHRFFGTAWEGAFSHRMPWLAWDLRTSRDVTTFPQQLLTLTSGGNVASLLDAILTTRYPDPLERARIVQDLIRRQGLPTSIGGPLVLYTQQTYISTGRSLSVGFLGVTNTLTFSAGYLRVAGVFPDVIVVSPSGFGNWEQIGSALAYSRRLSPYTTASLTAGRSYIRGFGAAGIEEARQRAIRALLTRQLSLRAEIAAGASRQLSNATVGGNFTENTAFIGFSKRF